MSKCAITYLTEQHAKARGHLESLVATTDRGIKTRTNLLVQIDQELRHHMRLEEEIYYPAFKQAVERKKDKTLYYEAKEEHHVAEKVLNDLMHSDVASLAFSGKAKVLKELVEHHIKEEEEEMFPIARQVLSSEELDMLGERMRARKRELKNGRAWDRSAVATSTL